MNRQTNQWNGTEGLEINQLHTELKAMLFGEERTFLQVGLR